MLRSSHSSSDYHRLLACPGPLTEHIRTRYFSRAITDAYLECAFRIGVSATNNSDSVADESLRSVESARYALLLRLAPALCHGLVGEMQALQFLADFSSANRNPAMTRRV